MSSYYCHKCRRRCEALERYNDGVRCGRCHEGFIEETDAAEEDDTTTSPGPASPLVLDGGDNPFGAFPGSPFARLFQHIHDHVFPAATTRPTTTTGGGGGNQRRSASEGPSTASTQHQQQTPPTNPSPAQQDNVQQHNNDLLTIFMDQVFAPLINQAQTENAGGRTQVIIQFGGDGAGGGGGLFNIHGNLQDYAWGDHGLDNVLTALLNTFDGTQQQMRALRPEDIAKLPMSKVTQKHVDNGTQCTTCMESFTLGETVAKLDCEHIFHPDCLKPWLARNNTCPICRSLIDADQWSAKISDIDELD